MQPLDDEKLKQILEQWTVPTAPASLEARLQNSRPRGLWATFLYGKISVPVPVGLLVLAAVLMLGAFTFRNPDAPKQPEELHFQLVDDLNPRIIRSSYEQD
jgi:hypothetical protein